MPFDTSFDRRNTIGASEVAAVLGLNPHKSPTAVWMEKTGRSATSQVETNFTRLGNLLEPIVATFVAESTGWDLVESPTIRHATLPISGTPDRLVRIDNQVQRVLEIKTAWTRKSQSAWGDPGTAEVPDGYRLQGIVYMALTDLPVCEFARFANGVVDLYTVERDASVESCVLDQLSKWWDDHVVADRPPTDLKASDVDLIRQRFPTSSGEMLSATPALDALAAAYAQLNASVDEMVEQRDALKAQLCSAIGPSDGLRGDGWSATWRQSKSWNRVDWESVARALNPPKTLIDAHTKPVAGSRRFLFTGRQQ